MTAGIFLSGVLPLELTDVPALGQRSEDDISHWQLQHGNEGVNNAPPGGAGRNRRDVADSPWLTIRAGIALHLARCDPASL
jgi:hypothetical protein